MQNCRVESPKSKRHRSRASSVTRNAGSATTTTAAIEPWLAPPDRAQYAGRSCLPMTNATLRAAVRMWNTDHDEALRQYDSISHWDTRLVTDMSDLFNEEAHFNAPLLHWDTARVTNMTGMFFGAVQFDQPIGHWDTANVTDMSFMFYEASRFNQPLVNWNTASVTDMSFMFMGASRFDQPLLHWRTGNVRDMSSMFHSASRFNQALGDWDVSNVADARFMFFEAPLMLARYPDGLDAPPAIRWSHLQHEWRQSWGRIERESPARAERVRRKHAAYIERERQMRMEHARSSGQEQPADLCVVCWERPSRVMFAKCRHVSLCESALCVDPLFDRRGVSRCPTCREPHRVDQVKSILQWCSEQLDDDGDGDGDHPRLFVSGGRGTARDADDVSTSTRRRGRSAASKSPLDWPMLRSTRIGNRWFASDKQVGDTTPIAGRPRTPT